MKRKMVQHKTDAGLYYATFERRGFDWERFIDNCMTALWVAFLFLCVWFAASTVVPALIG